MSVALILLLIGSQVLLVSGQLFLKYGMNLAERESRNYPAMLLHFGCFLATMTLWFLLWLGFLQTMPLSQVLPWEGLSPVLLVLGASVFLGEKIAPQAWLGVTLISAGVVLVSLS